MGIMRFNNFEEEPDCLCPGGPDRLVTDEGVVCRKCGIVLGERFVSNRERALTPEEVRLKTSHEPTPKARYKGWTTFSPLEAGGRRRLYSKLSRINESHSESKVRNMNSARHFIEQFCLAYNVPINSNVEQTALDIHEAGYDLGISRRKPIYPFAAGAFLLAMEDAGVSLGHSILPQKMGRGDPRKIHKTYKTLRYSRGVARKVPIRHTKTGFRCAGLNALRGLLHETPQPLSDEQIQSMYGYHRMMCRRPFDIDLEGKSDRGLAGAILYFAVLAVSPDPSRGERKRVKELIRGNSGIGSNTLNANIRSAEKWIFQTPPTDLCYEGDAATVGNHISPTVGLGNQPIVPREAGFRVDVPVPDTFQARIGVARSSRALPIGDIYVFPKLRTLGEVVARNGDRHEVLLFFNSGEGG